MLDSLAPYVHHGRKLWQVLDPLLHSNSSALINRPTLYSLKFIPTSFLDTDVYNLFANRYNKFAIVSVPQIVWIPNSMLGAVA